MQIKIIKKNNKSIIIDKSYNLTIKQANNSINKQKKDK